VSSAKSISSKNFMSLKPGRTETQERYATIQCIHPESPPAENRRFRARDESRRIRPTWMIESVSQDAAQIEATSHEILQINLLSDIGCE